MKNTFICIGKSCLAFLGVLILIVVGLFCWLFATSPGVLPPLVDEHGVIIPNQISERVSVPIGGMNQVLFLRGYDKTNPILLYLHGGPGSPTLPFMPASGPILEYEKSFTVCYWDQRGAGASRNGTKEELQFNMTRMIADAHEVTSYLKKRFGQEKILLVGHSWGSLLGVKVIRQNPEDYYAYFGIGQMANQLESERLSYAYMLNHAKEIGDARAVKALESVDINDPHFPTSSYLMGVRSMYQTKYKIGIFHTDKVSMVEAMMNFVTFKGYKLKEKFGFLLGTRDQVKEIVYGPFNENLIETERIFDIPFFVIQGDWDLQVSAVLAKKYVDVIQAPQKEYIEIPNTSHAPHLEEPILFAEALLSLIKKYNIPYIKSKIADDTEGRPKTGDASEL
ncbi:putative alpha/beta hydrolase [Blattamonas nauphoetae]|uniref:Alpha/beta hydrolase n=1 Tax=Blattamonas nauphoetae TaxID=2049346 RepID=A0ABQ9X2A2_9EUKA|nr:putative alpha/beta hydrolase [Blattamonas nauphoetae]